MSSVSGHRYTSSDELSFRACQRRDKLIEAVSSFDEDRVKKITAKINHLYLNEPMLSVYRDAAQAVNIKWTDTEEVQAQKKRILTILNQARDKFVKDEEFHELLYESD